MHALAPVAAREKLVSLVIDGVSSPHSRRAYSQALTEFLDWAEQQNEGFSKALVQRYRATLEARGMAPSTINVKLAAVRKLAAEAAGNGLLSPDAAAGVARVRGARRHGVRTGYWLTLDQARALLDAPDPNTLKGKRDRAMLALLLGAGLRREEAAGLLVSHLQPRDGRWVVADLEGKGNRIRTVPVPAWAKRAVDDWTAAAGISEGRLFHALGKEGRSRRAALTGQAVFLIVKHYAATLGLAAAPHDLRRTFAKLAYRGAAPLEQIQFSLGHASILTTERYLGVRQDLADAPCDRLGLEPL
jgi:integrase